MKRHLLTCENKTYLCEFDHDDNNNNNIEFKGNKNEILEHLKTSHPIHLLIFMESYYMFKNTIPNPNPQSPIPNPQSNPLF